MTLNPLEGVNAADNLNTIATLWPQLTDMLEPTNTKDNDGTSHPPPASRPPLNLHISDLMREIEEQARYYAHELLNETTDWNPATTTMPGLLTEIADRQGHWTAPDPRTTPPYVLERAPLEFCDWAEQAIHKVRTQLNPPDAATYLGPCPTEYATGPCGGDVYVRPGHDVGTCRTCRNRHDTRIIREQGNQLMQDMLMNLSEITTALTTIGCPTAYRTVQSWAHRKRLIPNADGRYRFNDARALAVDKQRYAS